MKKNPVRYTQAKIARRALLALALAFAALTQSAFAQGASAVTGVDFTNEERVNILVSLASLMGESVIADETVTGKTTFSYKGTPKEAFDAFLRADGLFSDKKNGIIFVSRVRVIRETDGTLSVDADDVDLNLVIKAMLRVSSVTIISDLLPSTQCSIHAEKRPAEWICAVLMKKFPSYSVLKEDGAIYIKKADSSPGAGASDKAGKPKYFTKTAELYDIDCEKGLFSDILLDLFKNAGNEYSLLFKNDSYIENFRFKSKSFAAMLRLLLEQANADYSIYQGVYYIFEVQRRDILKTIKTTETIYLKYISVTDLMNIMPPDLASGSFLRVEKTMNIVILYGSEEEVRPIREFVQKADRPMEGRYYKRFDLQFMKSKDLIPILPLRFAAANIIALPDGSSFIALVDDALAKELSGFISAVDREKPSYPIYLRYIKAEELIKYLPPSVQKEDIVETGNPSLIFFLGSDEKRKSFLRDLALIDKPKPQVKYDVLVILYTKSHNLNVQNPTISVGSKNPKSTLAVDQPSYLLGNVDKLFNLNFDILSSFGMEFALSLQSKLQDNQGFVFIDTTLQGLSGQDVKFQNTSTYRYIEYITDSSTATTTKTGVTREFSSGTFITVNGFVSGDGSITMTITATISRKTSDTADKPPDTSESVITTTLRTLSGKPIVVNGYLRQERQTQGGTEVIGEALSEDEVVLYIIPRAIPSYEGESDPGAAMQAAYNRFPK